MKSYRVVILGSRARGYAAHPRTEVVALCDLEPQRADTLGDECPVPTANGSQRRMRGWERCLSHAWTGAESLVYKAQTPASPG
jgi:predicted dehydrogenase